MSNSEGSSSSRTVLRNRDHTQRVANVSGGFLPKTKRLLIMFVYVSYGKSDANLNKGSITKPGSRYSINFHWKPPSGQEGLPSQLQEGRYDACQRDANAGDEANAPDTDD